MTRAAGRPLSTAGSVPADEGLNSGGCGCILVAFFTVVYVLFDIFFFEEKSERSSVHPAPPACIDGRVVRTVRVCEDDLVWCDDEGHIRVKSPPRVQGGLYAHVNMSVVCPCSGSEARLEVLDGRE